MENLTPPTLNAVRQISWRIHSGKSMFEAVNIYLGQCNDSFARSLREAWILKNQGQISQKSLFSSVHQQALWNLIERGAHGQPTSEALRALELEVEMATSFELEEHLGSLPFKVLLPLLFFLFPAYLILLLGPVLRQLNQQMGM